jgi:hypothetical protein
LYYLKKALSLPPHITLIKALRKIRNLVREKKSRIRDELFSTFEREVNSSLRTFVQPCDLSFLPKEILLEQCEFILDHRFDLLGSGLVQVRPGMNCNGIEGNFLTTEITEKREQKKPLSVSSVFSVVKKINQKNKAEKERIRALISKEYKPIDWHIDFKSGYRWDEDVLSQEIRYGDVLGADVKVPWELARMQHLSVLGWGYAIKRDPTLITEFQNQILDFIAANPPRYGVNWVCTMDVGIRIANWLLAYDLFRAYGAQFDEEFERVFYRSVYEHGKHIISHLEWDPYLRSNHYLANIAGLLFVGVYTQNEKWLQFAHRELISETLSQFYPDGSNFEASTSYHRLSAEMVVYASALALDAGFSLPKEYLERIQKMGDFIRDITKPDGTIVQFGDNDSGRFLKLFPDRDLLDHRYLISVIRNLSGINAVIRARGNGEVGPSLCKYPDFGLYIHKTEPWMVAIRCGSIGQKGNGGHAHNDQLSFEMAVRGISMVIDPGTYVYTPLPKERRRFRSTAMHNTLVIEGKEQNLDEGLFKMKDRAHSKALKFEEGLFVGEHSGFGSTYRRTLKWGKDFEGQEEFKEGPKAVHFHISSDWRLVELKEKELTWECKDILVKIIADRGKWSVENEERSIGYGLKESCSRLKLTAFESRISWKFLIIRKETQEKEF